MKIDFKDSGTASVLKNIMIDKVPSYGNKFFYSLGFLSMVCFFVLVITGILLVFFGPDWWLTTQFGSFIRGVHLWAIQGFIVFILLHLLIVFLTGGYRPPRRFVWVLGSLLFFFALLEAEFGYVLRDDFSSQWRSLQGADLYNGSGIGTVLNNLNYMQIYGIHIVIIPFIILGIMFLHYALVRLRGIATPYKKTVPYHIVKANHSLLFFRGLLLVGVLVFLAIIFPSPFIAPVSIKQIATQDPALMAQTLLSELDHSSDTATYLDTIDPYAFDTKEVYIVGPYTQYMLIQQHALNMLSYFTSENEQTQANNIKLSKDYFSKSGQITTVANVQNPVIPLISSLVIMGQSGLYESSLQSQSETRYNPMYTTRFLSDTGVLEDQATRLGITTPQYGMLREGKGVMPPGAWWLAPLGLLDNTVLKNDDNQDRDGAEILGVLLLIFVAFPYIPLLNQLPDKLGLYRFFWREPGNGNTTKNL